MPTLNLKQKLIYRLEWNVYNRTKLKKDIYSNGSPPPATPAALDDPKPISVVFPPCADVLLSLIRSSGTTVDEISTLFNEYFSFAGHKIIQKESWQAGILDSNLDAWVSTSTPPSLSEPWPPERCFPTPKVTLSGNRHTGPIKRLYIGDLAWLFYFERIGIFQILGRILDEYTYGGRLPISNGANMPNNLQSDLIAIVLETMVRQTEAGISSKVRDRNSAYRRCLGWTSDVGRKLDLDTVVNTEFNTRFRDFIQSALGFYKDKRLAEAIMSTRASTSSPRPSVYTLTMIQDTLKLLKRSFSAFDYGRNYSNTLSGIVWALAAMSLIRDLRSTLGISEAEYDKPDGYISAAYDILILKRPITPSESNRYTIHKQCADNARDILLDIEVLDLDQDAVEGGELDEWLKLIESKVEGCRGAYRSLTGVDLGAPGTPTIEQQA